MLQKGYSDYSSRIGIIEFQKLFSTIKPGTMKKNFYSAATLQGFLQKRTMSLGLIALLGTASLNFVQAQNDPVQPYKGKIGRNLSETQQAWPEKKKAPEGAPNVVWILLDDIGFGAVSTFGGLIQTPTIDSLANNGLRYTNFHTTAICSPTRSALLTGRNSHSVHMGLFPTTAIGTPGYDGIMPFEKATVAEILKENGYSTFAVGKWHLIPPTDENPAGPFNRWPTGRGFDHYFGFLSGSTDQWHPVVYEDTRKADLENNKKHFSTLMADKAIDFIADQKSSAPEKPFFLYFTPGAGHSPHQVAPEWSAKYKGKFDQGWDKYREEVLANQIKAGIVPKGTKLPPREVGVGVKEWATLSGDEKKLYARFMEVYAGFVSHADYEIGRVIRYLKEINQLENTLVFVSVGDNGGSRGGTQEGIIYPIDAALSPEDRLKKNLANIDAIGTERSNVNNPIGWSFATNTPFKHYKQDANAEGGTRNPLIVFYPKGIREKGGIRTQYGHVIDLLPTTVALTGTKIPDVINGYKQEAVEGTNLAATINDPTAPSQHTLQHYEIMGSRSLYHNGWKAAVWHIKGEDFGKDKWELYNLNEDFNELNDVATKYPGKLKELQALFDVQANKFNIYPLKDEFIPSVAPNIYTNKDHITIYPGVSQIFEASAPKLTNRSFSIIADVEIPKEGAEGVLFSAGGWYTGLSLFVQNKKLHFVYNNGNKKYLISSAVALPQGPAQLKVDLNYHGSEPGGAADAVLFINNEKVGNGAIDKTVKGSIGTYEGLEAGKDPVSPVADNYKSPFSFTGNLKKVSLDFSTAPLQSSNQK
jgi:arylsulfatase A-like enzyme